MTQRNVTRIGLDLDGVIIDKPPGIPKYVLEWLVRSCQKGELAYRYPTLKIERAIRWLSHTPLLRPPIRENLELIKKIAQIKGIKLYLISSRYAFLDGRTKSWLNHHRIAQCFKTITLNWENKQPHLFKEEMIEKLKVQIFVDDDAPLVEYLSRKLPNRKILCLNKSDKDKKEALSINWIESLKEIIPK